MRDQNSAVRRHLNGKAVKNGLDGSLSWAADVPVPFVPVSTDMEGPPPVSSSIPPWTVKGQPSPAPPASPPVQLEESGRSFHDAGPMLQRALLRKKLEHAVDKWLVLVEHARADGRSTSPTAIRRAEEAIERVAKALREIK